MRERFREVIAELETRPPMLPVAEIAEGLEFLRWLDDDHFTYLGYREIVFQGSGANAVSKVSKARGRSEEHTSELQSLMRISYAVFCLKKNKKHNHETTNCPYENIHNQ